MGITYACRAGYTPENCGVIAAGKTSIDVKAALEQGDGLIVVPDGDLTTQAALDNYTPIRRVSDTEHAANVLVDTFSSMPYAVLRDEARNRGLRASGTKDELLMALRTHEAAQSGDTRTAEVVAAAAADDDESEA